MIIQKKCIAMLLAGGQGSRLYVLTRDLAKPAVPFGAKYRIIDFTLSNCTNSGIDTVGVLTQYQPFELNTYIGTGQPWDLDRMNGGIFILPPYANNKAAEWYKGTANAIYQNIHFIERYSPEYVLVLSGDHIYKMDYSKMLSYHIEKNADCTIAVLDVPPDEASRFGIVSLDESGAITGFQEKPKTPKSTKASMGIYIFNWPVLRKFLTEDEKKPKSSNDFGKDIIPAMLGANMGMYAYLFEGYWKDVGTIESLWEANMDILNPNIPLKLNDPDWRIYSRSPAEPPHFIGDGAKIAESMITEGCTVYGNLWYSILFHGVTVGKDSEVKASILMRDVKVGAGAKVKYAIVADDAIIEDGAIVGGDPEDYPDRSMWGIAVIGRGAVVRKGQVVAPKEMIEAAGDTI